MADRYFPGANARGFSVRPAWAYRPKGVTDKRRGRFRRAIQEKGDKIVKVIVAAALEGDTDAKFCLDRLAPPLRPSAEPIELDLPEGSMAQEQAALVLAVIAKGEVDPVKGNCRMPFLEELDPPLTGSGWLSIADGEILHAAMPSAWSSGKKSILVGDSLRAMVSALRAEYGTGV